MGSVVPLKKSANSAYLELKNLLNKKLEKVEELIQLKLKSEEVDFWSNSEEAKEVMREISELENNNETIRELDEKLISINEFSSLAIEESDLSTPFSILSLS